MWFFRVNLVSQMTKYDGLLYIADDGYITDNGLYLVDANVIRYKLYKSLNAFFIESREAYLKTNFACYTASFYYLEKTET